MCAHAYEREKDGGNLGMKEEFGWLGKKSRRLLEKWRSWIFDQRYVRDAANGWYVVGRPR
jgi:hypothetical protein